MAAKRKAVKRVAKKQQSTEGAKSGRRWPRLLVILFALVVVCAVMYIEREQRRNDMKICAMTVLQGHPVFICMSPEQFFEEAGKSPIQPQATPARPTHDLEKQI